MTNDAKDISPEEELAALEEDIHDAKRDLYKMETRREELINLTGSEYKDLAAFLHRTECKLDHTDQCAWGYEESWMKDPENPLGKKVWTEDMRAHSRWLKTARKRVRAAGVSPAKFAEAVTIVNGL